VQAELVACNGSGQTRGCLVWRRELILMHQHVVCDRNLDSMAVVGCADTGAVQQHTACMDDVRRSN
jgi:hypothetical protein